MTIREEIVFKQGLREVKRIYGTKKNIYLACYLRRKTRMTCEEIGDLIGYSQGYTCTILNTSDKEKKRLELIDLT